MATRHGNSGGRGGPVASHPSNQPGDAPPVGGTPAIDPNPGDNLDAQVVELVLDELDDPGDEASHGSGGTLHTLVTEPRHEPDVYDYDEAGTDPGGDLGKELGLLSSDDGDRFNNAPEQRPGSVGTASSSGSIASVGSAGSIASTRSVGSIASGHSVGSIASGHSAGALASAFSAGSIISLSSVGSLASILSVGSYRSILSIGSRNSILSIGADGGFLTIGRGAQARSLLRR